MTEPDCNALEKAASKRAYQKAWREANKERLKAKRAVYQKQYYQAHKQHYKSLRDANKEKMKAYLKDYYEKNRDALRAQMAASYRNNADEYKRRARKWETLNPERKRELRTQYRAANREKTRESSRRDWQKHGDKRRAAKALHRRQFPELGAHHCRLRQTRKQQATPTWADLGQIKALYREAARLRKETGDPWHVDHVIPLRNELVCGLHCEFNLRVVPGAVNQSKGNAFVIT